MTYKVMVYGSLKRGFYNNSFFPVGAKFVKNVSSKQGYTMFSLGAYPAVVEIGHGIIHGELWEVPDMIRLDRLDRLEQNGRVYTRYERPFEDSHGNIDIAWIYLMPPGQSLKNIIPDGIWRE